MAHNKIVREDTLTNVGGTITYNYNDAIQQYIIKGTAGALAGNWTITSSAGDIKGTTYNIKYIATAILGAFNITIFGTALTAEQALKQANIEVYYDGSAYKVTISPDFEDSEIVGTSNIVDGAITTVKLDQTGGSEAVTTATIRDLNVTTPKIAAGAITTAKLDTTGASEAVTTATIRDLNVTTGKLANLAVTTAKIDNLAVTDGKIADATISVAKFSPAALALLNTCGISCVKVTIPTAQVLTLNTIPVQIVAAPGAGLVIQPIAWFVKMVYNTTPYATNTDLVLYTDTSTGNFGGAVYTLLDVVDSIRYGGPIGPGLNIEMIENKAILLKVTGGNPTAGDSDIDVYLTYRTVTL